jgi:hypothetical protein
MSTRIFRLLDVVKHFDATQDHHKRSLGLIQDKIDPALLSEFTEIWRNGAKGSESVKILNLPIYFSNLPWQIAALNMLQDKLEVPLLIEATAIWDSVKVASVSAAIPVESKNFKASLVPNPNYKVLADLDFVNAAKLLGCSIAAIRAVVEVESDGYGFHQNGYPTILFERHWFYDLSPAPVSQTRPDISNYSPGGYIGGFREWSRLKDAIAFDRTAALKSASWGLGQVMGFNHAICGYPDVERFVSDMFESEGKQLLAMMQFCKSNGLGKYLASRDFESFAYFYNGENFSINQYDVKLADAYARYA